MFGLTALTSLAAVMRALMSFNLFLRASKVLHNTMLGSVLRATIQFYDTNPIGRILNRFARFVLRRIFDLSLLFFLLALILLFCYGSLAI